ncbi:fimbria/pilus outer membrane usher protein [Parasphingopyxis sp.]|uniref:fimbria/pilus outer membrane usher protein n=1 Tax=Parasphingopyxis sp. TaxID=1920299 RepID=UPI00262738CC|nr:fimbria/pilus outer membrane usher protein [Parasphingopyxis sp.]
MTAAIPALVAAQSMPIQQASLFQEAPTAAGTGPDPDPTPASTERQRVNVFGRTIDIVVPIRQNGTPLGTIATRIDPDDRFFVPINALSTALRPIAADELIARIDALPSADGYASFVQLRSLGISIDYDPSISEIRVMLPREGTATAEISLTETRADRIGSFEEPAGFSGFINIRGAMGYDAAGAGEGFVDPFFDFETALRFGGFVLENDFAADLSGGDSGGFRRLFSRLVYDIPTANMRLSAGDLIPSSANFLPPPDIFGFGVERQDGLFNPQRNLRTQSFQSFSLQETSTVEVIVNGSEVRRIQLEPGNYRLSDFPLGIGANDVQVVVTDNFGRREIANFSRFFNFSVLAPGETEYGFYAGFQNDFGTLSRSYDWDRPTVSAFFRRGMSDILTLGAGFQADDRTQAGSIETALGTRAGLFVAEAAISRDDVNGTGFAGRFLYQLPSPATARGIFAGFGLSVDYTSSKYTNVGRFVANRNLVSIQASTTLALRITDRDFLSLNGNYSRFRAGIADTYEVSARYSRRIGRSTVLAIGAGYGRSRFGGEEPIFRVTLSRRFGRRGFGSAAYNTIDDRLRLNYNHAGGRGTGAINVAASADIGDDTTTGGGSVFYLANNAELSVTHSTAYEFDSNDIATSRTTAQIGTSLMFADGSFTVGRPVRDSFAIVRGHPTLEGAPVYIDRTDEGYFSRSNFLGGASTPELGSYVERTITVDVPDAPIGYDLGAASFRLLPPYKSGYNLVIGSDFTITAIGTLLNNGAPVALATGVAELIDEPDAPTISLFTNRVGRFAASGLKPGRWIITLATEPPLVYELDIPAEEGNLIRTGELEAR